MIPKNLPEFKALIERYETITIEEIKKENMNLFTLTRNEGMCILCEPIGGINPQCELCVYYQIIPKRLPYPCLSGINRETFGNIGAAKTPLTLLNAYRNRAKHMRSILKKLNLE